LQVQASPALHCICHPPGDLGLSRDVHSGEHGVAAPLADLGHRVLAPGGVKVADRNAHAMGGQLERSRTADAASAAADGGDRAVIEREAAHGCRLAAAGAGAPIMP